MTSALIGIMSSVITEEYGNRRLYVNGVQVDLELDTVSITTTIGNIIIPDGLELASVLSAVDVDAKINYDPDYSNVVLLTHFDGTENSQLVLDNSQYERTLVTHGNVKITNEQRKFAQSAYFDGSGDYLTIPYAAELTFNNVDFTIEGWAYNSGNVNYVTLIDFRGSGVYNSSWAIYIHNSANTLNVYDGPTSSTKLSTPINTLSKNQWFHFSVTRDSGNVTLRVNNTIFDSKIYNPPVTHDSGIKIATNYNNGDSFTGYLDDFRFTRNSVRVYPAGLPNYSYYDGNNITIAVNDVAPTVSLGQAVGIVYPANAITLIPPISSYGIVSSNSFVWYTINLISTSIIYARVYSPTYLNSLSPVIALYDDRGSLLVTDGSEFSYTASIIFNDAEPGLYYIGVARGSSVFYDYFETTTISQPLTGWNIALEITVTDKDWANVVLLTHFDGTNGSRSFVDSSSYNRSFSYNGETALSTSQFKFGNAALYLDGTRDYIQTYAPGSSVGHSTSSTHFKFGLSDFTIECWIKTSDSDFVIIDYWLNGSGYYSNGYKLAVNSSGYLTWWNNLGIVLQATSNSVNDNQWNHIAVTRQNQTLRFFVNGVLSGNVIDSTDYDNNYNSYIYIGAEYYTPSHDMSGYIDDLRIINGSAKYVDNFTAPTEAFQNAPDGWHIITGVSANTATSNNFTIITDSIFTPTGIQLTASPGTVLLGVQTAVDPYYGNVTVLMHFDGSNNSVTFTDSSSYIRTPTIYGNTKLNTVQFKYGTTSAYFDGNGDYVTFPVSSDFNMSSGDFTVECWVYVNPGPVGYNYYRPYIFEFIDPTDSYSRRWALYMSAQQKFVLYTSAIYGYGADRIISSIKQYNQWYHIAIVKSGNVGTLYVNGVSEGNTASSTTSETPPSFTPITVTLPLTNLVVTDQGNIVNRVAWYKFQLTELSQITISTGGLDTVNTTVVLFNSVGTAIASDDDSGPGTLSLLTVNNLSSGTYYVAVGYYYLSTSYYTPYYAYSYGTAPTGDFILSITAVPQSIWPDANLSITLGYQFDSYSTDFNLNGFIDEFRVTKGVARYTDRFVPPVGIFQNTDNPNVTITTSGFQLVTSLDTVLLGIASATDEYYGNVVLLTHFDGSNNDIVFVDNSQYSRAITRVGDTKLSNVQVKYGSASSFFDGTGDYLTAAWDTGFEFGTGDFTIEMWVYPTRALSGTGIIGGTYTGGADTIPWALASGTTAGASSGSTLFFGNYNGSSWTSINTTYSLTSNVWTHLSVTRSSGNLKIFANGVIVGTGNLTVNMSTDTVLRIGHRWDTSGTNSGFQGYMDEVRITKGIARYTDRFVPQVGIFPNTDTPNVTITFNIDRNYDINYDNVILGMHFDGSNNSTTFIDSSKYNRTITVNGNAKLATSPVKFGTASGYFDGSGDYLTIASDANLAMSTNNFTMEAWVYPLSLSTNMAITGTTAYNSGASLRLNANTIWLDSSGSASKSVTAYPLLNAWNHIAVTRQTGDLFRFFLNGTQVGSDIIWSQNFSGQTVAVGGSPADNSLWFNGYIDDLRITANVAKYTSNFTPDITAFGGSIPSTLSAITNIGNSLILFNSSEDTQFINVSLLLHGEGANNSVQLSDNSLYNNTLISVGDTKISTLRSKFGISSIAFDGTGDYIIIPNNARFQFASGDFTIEAFVYQNVAQSGSEGAIATLWGTQNSWYFGINTSSQLVFYYSTTISGGTFSEVAGTVATSQWVHVAVTRSGSTLRLFINGTVVRTNASFTANLYSATNAVGIGGQSNGGTPIKSAYIDELRITKGFARYTANFATPTTQFYDGVNIFANPTTSLITSNIGNILVFTDQILAVSGVQSITNFGNSNIVITPQESFDNYFDSVVLLSHFDGSNASTTFVDSSSYNRPTQVFGNVIINTNQSISGNSSVYFNGVGDYLSLLNTTDFNLRTSDFTLETWIYVTSQPTTLWPVYSISTSTASPLSVYLNASKYLTIDINGNVITSNTFAVSSNTWTNIAVTRNSNTVRGFVNGEIVFQTTNAFDFNSATEVRVGRGPRTSTDYAAGYIDELRVTKSIGRYTVPYTPTARYTEPIDTDPYYSNVALLMHFSGANSTTFVDNSISNRSFTRFGDTIISNVQSKFGNTSLYLDGTGDYLTTTWDSGFAFGTADFTIEMWIYPTRDGNGTGILGGTYTGGSDSVNWALATGSTIGSATGNTIYFANFNGSAWTGITTTYVPSTNNWTHLAIARNSGNLRIFANGSLIGSGSYTQNLGTDTLLRIGNRWDNSGGNSAFQGYIDEIRITNGISRYFANFTPATTSFLEISQFDLTTNAIVQLSSVAVNVANVTISSDLIANLPVISEYLANGAISSDLVYNSPTILENPANGAISSDLIATPISMPGWPESYSLVTLLLSFDGANNSTTFTDSSLFNRSITRTGDTKISTVQSKFGTSSAYFDGSGDYLSTATDAAFYLTGGDFTVELWVYLNSIANTPHLFQIGTSASNRWNVYMSGGSFILYSNNGTGANRITSTVKTTGQWYYLSIVKVGTTTSMYVNGLLEGTTTTTAWPTGSLSVALGTQHFSPVAGDYLNGYIDDFRITKGLGRYTANYATPTRAFFSTSSSTVTVVGSQGLLYVGDVTIIIE